MVQVDEFFCAEIIELIKILDEAEERIDGLGAENLAVLRKSRENPAVVVVDRNGVADLIGVEVIGFIVGDAADLHKLRSVLAERNDFRKQITQIFGEDRLREKTQMIPSGESVMSMKNML